MKVAHEAKPMEGVADLLAEFQALTGLPWQLPPDLQAALQDVFSALGPAGLRPAEDRQRQFHAAVNAKLKLSQPAFKRILDAAAEHDVFFNYHQKADIQRALDENDRAAFYGVLLRASTPPRAYGDIVQQFQPPAWEETRHAFQRAIAEDERSLQLHRSLFSAFAFLCFQPPLIHDHFAGEPSDSYFPQFYDHLRRHLPHVFHRSCGLALLTVDDHWLEGVATEQQIRARVLNGVTELAQRLSNHCYLAVLLKPLTGGEARKWGLYSDIVLYAEKYRAVRLQKGYFQPDKIAGQTQSYIPDLDVNACRFDLAHEGLYYKDCFVITYQPPLDNSQLPSEPDLLLLFEKNERDETPIPCPACRSSNIQGNSYPVLGVRSWECNNLICPERSKYDRGNRYSMASLLRQEAIEEEAATIPVSSLRQWKRDIVVLDSEAAVLQMLVKHYSLLDDRVLVTNTPILRPRLFGRTIVDASQEVGAGTMQSPAEASRPNDVDDFFQSPYFRRFYVPKKRGDAMPLQNMSGVKGVQVYCGDCFDILPQIGDDSIDGIVTSPPYYNARAYAQWPNIYCFLYDQYNVVSELYRVLKSGGLLLYNIFDYFDNENNIVFSAMGKKRMILGAYAINLFRRVGLELVTNVVWDKGEIEGKRNFNQGNRSPYYQAPFNCWEHVLVFCKGDSPEAAERLPYILRAQPVTKMVGGRNILGHTAPFPEAIPNLLLDLLEPRATVLDPYAGSMTTARAAFRHGLRSISIDYKEEYCRLGLRLLMEQEWNLLADL